MPEMDGIETLKRIREKGDDVDIILITAAQEGNIIKEVMRFGAFDYIIKPFTFERVKAALDSYRQLFERINFELADKVMLEAFVIHALYHFLMSKSMDHIP